MSYALIELDTGNMVGFFPSERAALEEVLDSINRYGVESVETLGLAFNDPDPAGPVRRIAAGTALAQLALTTLQATPAPAQKASRPRRSTTATTSAARRRSK